MVELSDGEKLRILEVRARTDSGGKRLSWDEVCEETHHSKKTVLGVERWFQSLPWNVVEGLHQAVQRLRHDYLLHLEQAVMSDRPQVLVTKVGPVPDVPSWYAHNMGRIPTSVSVTPINLGTPAPIFVGTVTDRYIQLQSQPNCSGAIGEIRLEYDPKMGSLPWLATVVSGDPSQQ